MAATPLDVQDAALARIRALLLRDLDRIWDGLLDRTDPAGSLARVGPLAAARIVAAQSAALAVAVGYADAVLAAAFGSAMLPVAVPGAALIGVDRRGRDIAAMLAGSQGAFERRVSSGLPPPDAVRAERSFQSALASSAVHDTGRTALAGLADPRSGWRHPQVEGWSRVAHPGACAFCVMLAGRGYAYTSEKSARTARDGSRYHDRCRCSVAIGPAGTRDPAAEASYRQWTAGSGGTVGTGGRRQPAVPPGPRLSDTDQARLNAANSEANRLNAQAYKLEEQGRHAEAAALREQAAVHRAEADRITDTLHGTAGGPMTVGCPEHESGRPCPRPPCRGWLPPRWMLRTAVSSRIGRRARSGTLLTGCGRTGTRSQGCACPNHPSPGRTLSSGLAQETRPWSSRSSRQVSTTPW